jgi:hypothetical protein
VSLAVAGVFGLALLLRRTAPAARTAGPLGVALLLAGLAVVSLEGRALPWSHPVYFGAFALPGDYRTIGADVGRLVGAGAVRSPGEIGTLAYACDCAMSDVFSDPGRTLPLIERRIGQAGPVGRFLLELNFARLDRDVRPLPLSHVIAWTQEGSPPGVRTWPTHSPATGPATVYLQPVG